MNFECKQLTISVDSNYGCTIEFSDSSEIADEILAFDKQLQANDKYLLIQRSYPEEEDEIDWYTVETSEDEIDFSQKDKIYITLNKELIKVYCSGVSINIGLKLSGKEYSNLEKILKTRFKGKVVMREE